VCKPVKTSGGVATTKLTRNTAQSAGRTSQHYIYREVDYRTTISWDHNIHSKEIYKRKPGFISYFSRKRSSQESSRESYRRMTRFIRSFSTKKKRFFFIVKMEATKSIASPGATTRASTSGRSTERAPGK
jgi:spore coat protein CotH